MMIIIIIIIIIIKVIIIIIVIIILIIKIISVKIIYIAPNPLKGSRRFTKSVTAILQHKSSTIKYKHIHFSCILMNQMYQWERNLNTKMGLEKVGLKVLFNLTFTLGFSDIRW